MRYDPRRVSPAQMLEVIAELGYQPSIASMPEPAAETAAVNTTACDDFPEPIAQALDAAQKAGKPLFLDFFAEWCVPCHVLEEEILPDPAVAAGLESYDFLRIDTDRSPEAARCLDVYGLPTLVVLGPSGAVVFRHEGLLEPEELAAALWQARSRIQETSR